MKVGNKFQPLTIFAKNSVLDVRQSFKYTSAISLDCSTPPRLGLAYIPLFSENPI